MREAFRAVRAGAGSTGPERAAIAGLLASAHAGIAAARNGHIGELRAACERAWALATSVLHDWIGLVLDLVPVPVAPFIALCRHAAHAARGRRGEEPLLLAQALLWLGTRLLQTRRDDEALGHLFSAWSLLRGAGLYPSREEAWAIRLIAQSYGAPAARAPAPEPRDLESLATLRAI
eukprot:tig00020996_g16947.t1